MTLPAFGGVAGALTACALFVGLTAIQQAYRVTFMGLAWNDFASPLPLLVVMMVVAAITAACVLYFLGKGFQQILNRVMEYLNDARQDASTQLGSMSFMELRQLRIAATRAVRRLRSENEQLRRVAFIESRTGLPNMIALDAAIERTLSKATFDAPAAFFLLDLDHLNRVAERHGHTVTNALLRAAGNRLTEALAALEAPIAASTEDALIAALPGDQFAIYLPNALSRENVSGMARALRAAFAQPFDAMGQAVSLGVSGGIVMAPEDADSSQKLVRHAELALRQVRAESAYGFRYFSPRLNRVARGKYMLEAELREAVANHEFRAVFQPKIDFATGRIVGAEALARWQRTNGKMISPAAFIPLAEETGLVNQIGEQILESACKSAKIWTSAGYDVSVAVNVSPRQFVSVDLTELVLDVLRRTGLSPNKLELEITESMAVSEPAKVARVMRPLRALGLKLAIDDFGTGHSNLSMLTQLPFDVFKIDRQFVMALEADKQAPAIVEMILAMAETLGLKTVAEGVETERQADFLRRRGCTMAQGFLYSPGLPHDKFMDLLRGWDTRNDVIERKAS